MQKQLRNLLAIAVLFFMWGFVTNLNGILMPFLKRACQLTDFQTAFVDTAFYGAYFLMSIPASWVIKRLGYHKSLVLGLIVALAGSLIFQPAASKMIYLFFLLGLAVLGSGFTLLQVAANPYASLLGEPSGAASRLSLMGGLNSLGATLGPYIGGLLILSPNEKTAAEIAAMGDSERASYLSGQAELVHTPYLVLTGFLIVLAVVIYFSKLPPVAITEDENTNKKLNVFKHPRLALGILGIFFYVGAEVGVAAFMIRYGQYLNLEGYTDLIGKDFLALYGLGAMIFRFIGIPLLKKVDPSRALFVNACIAIALIILSMIGSGYFSLFAVALVGCCNAMMWPIIFPKAIEGLGSHTAKASSYLIMGIIGGALIPPVMGLISDASNIRLAYLVPVVCYLFIAFYGWRFRRNQQKSAV